MNVADGLDDGWFLLAGVGAGYALAVGVVFLLFFVAPYLTVAAL